MKSKQTQELQAIDEAMKEIELQRIKKPVNPYRQGFTDGLAVAWLALHAAKSKITDEEAQ